LVTLSPSRTSSHSTFAFNIFFAFSPLVLYTLGHKNNNNKTHCIQTQGHSGHNAKLCANCCQPSEYATPAGLKVAVQPPASAFRNVSYQRATHESVLGDSAVNHSPADETITAAQDATPVNNAANSNRPSVDNSEVRQRLLRLMT